jgi:hypothetical protein
VKSKSTSTDKSKQSYLQRFLGVDRWCTVYEEDEGFKLLADLSLCTYFGCGGKDNAQVPKVVSVTNSEDNSCSDTISDLCDPRFRNNEGSDATGVTCEAPRKGYRNEAAVKHEIRHPPAAPRVDTPICDEEYDLEESSQVSANCERRKTPDSVLGYFPPQSEVRIVRARKMDRSWNMPSMMHGKIKPKAKRQQETPMVDYSGAEYPVIMYPVDNFSNSGRCIYV